jgi:hypothetical protein
LNLAFRGNRSQILSHVHNSLIASPLKMALTDALSAHTEDNVEVYVGGPDWNGNPYDKGVAISVVKPEPYVARPLADHSVEDLQPKHNTFPDHIDRNGKGVTKPKSKKPK